MRLAVLLFGVALAGCTTSMPPSQSTGLMPDAGGLHPAGTDLRIDFGRAQPGVIDTVSRLLGARPDDITENRECGAGAVTSAHWQNGLVLNFIQGDFRGWYLDQAGLPVGPDSLQVGTAPPDIALQTTTLGREFEQSGIFGLVDDTNQITGLWSGVTCFFR